MRSTAPPCRSRCRPHCSARFTGQFFTLDPAGPALGLLSSTGAVEVLIGS